MYDIHDKSTYDIFRTNHRAGNLSSETDFSALRRQISSTMNGVKNVLRCLKSFVVKRTDVNCAINSTLCIAMHKYTW